LAGLELLLDFLGFGDVGPESRFRGGAFEKGYFFFLAGEVKDTPIGGLRGPSDW
jgi:hypothetical protein